MLEEWLAQNGYLEVNFFFHDLRFFISSTDLVFHTQETIQKVCTCAGGHLVNKENFRFTLESAKADSPGHDTSTGLIQAWIKYSQVTDIHQWSKEVLHAAKRTLDPALMEFFGYFYQLSHYDS